MSLLPVSTDVDTESPRSNALAVTYRKISELTRYAKNARTHSQLQIRKIAESIRVFGFTNPVLIDRDDSIVAGHGRVSAAALIGLTEVPTIRLENLTRSQVRAYVIADNRLAEKAGWDNEILKIELQNIVLDGEIDVSLTGFEMAEIDILIGTPAEDPDDTQLPSPAERAISVPGDLWLLGKHRILCGDARNPKVWSALMEDRRAAMAFADPPYNVVIDGNVSGKGAIKHKDFAMAVGEMSSEEFTQFLRVSLKNLSGHCRDGAVNFVCMDWRHMGELQEAARSVYGSLLNVCVWVKNNGGLGSFYRSRHELIYVYRCGKMTHRNNVQLGKFGRYRTNVWEYPAVRALEQQQDSEGNLLSLHPTVKPVALIADSILDCTARGELVLDSFLGSGSTLIAAERTGRVCCGIEIEPKFVDVAIQRWQEITGEPAIHAASGMSFHERKLKELVHG